jgi:hypothetical protein
MGATDHGGQSITWGYFLEATALNFGKRLLNQLPVGIYSGGYLTRVSDSQVTLSAFAVEIRDDVSQVNVRTELDADLNSSTLDSGAISSATPYLVMRWSFVESLGNFMEIHAISSLSDRQQNDVVIGKCVFSGSTLSSFDYSDRTFPVIQDQNLRVEATSDTELYVRVRGGRFNSGNTTVKIGDQKVGPFAVPGSGLSRIDLVYITLGGAVGIQQGTASVTPSAPSYEGKLVLAEVRVVNGDTNITWDRITDTRSFLNHPALVDETSIGIDSSGRMYVVRDSIAPYWNVSVMDANNLTLPSEFTSPIAEFKDPSYGTINKSHSGFINYWMLNNSVRFRMGVRVVSNITKTLKLFTVDNTVRVYIDGVEVYSRTSLYSSSESPLNVNLVLTSGNHTIDVVFNDQGGSAHLNLVGDIIDNSSVFFRAP